MPLPSSVRSYSIRPLVSSLYDELVRIRRTIHRHPELGMREERTSALVAGELEKLGLDVARGVGGTGVVGLLFSTRPDKKEGTLLLRADMDGLPIQEENPGIDYASEVPGVMHACGHDGHTAILLGTAMAAAAMRNRLPGDLKFVFQPAEEGPGGAMPMIDGGVLEDPKVTAAVGLHLDTDEAVGTVGLRPGPMMAAADEFELLVTGRGGHGAYPHQTVDAIVVGAHIVTALQTLVSRNTDPTAAAVVTVGIFEGGHNFNIIAERVRMKGTVRTFDPSLRERLKQRVGEVSETVARAMGAKCEMIYRDGYPPVVNDEGMTALLRSTVSGLLGEGAVSADLMSMGGEDMSYFLERVPGVFFFLGGRNEEKGLVHPHHSPRFDFDEAAMPLGVEIFLRFIEAHFQRD